MGLRGRILGQGVAQRFQRSHMVNELVFGLRKIDGAHLVGPPTSEHRCGVFSIRVDGVAPNVLAERLEREHGILTRAGLHCAPGAHATFDTDRAGGTTRLSLGPFLEADDVRAALDGIATVASRTAELVSS